MKYNLLQFTYMAQITHTGGAHAAASRFSVSLSERKGLWAQVWLIRLVAGCGLIGK